MYQWDDNGARKLTTNKKEEMNSKYLIVQLDLIESCQANISSNAA